MTVYDAIKNSNSMQHTRKGLIRVLATVLDIKLDNAKEELESYEDKGLIKCTFDGTYYRCKTTETKKDTYVYQEAVSCPTIAYDIYSNMKMVHVGENNAISMSELSLQYDISERKLRQIIFNINNRLYTLKNGNTFKRKILGDNNGYYVVANDLEVNRYLNKYKHKLIEAAKVLRIGIEDFGRDEQMKLKISEFENDLVKSISDDL